MKEGNSRGAIIRYYGTGYAGTLAQKVLCRPSEFALCSVSNCDTTSAAVGGATDSAPLATRIFRVPFGVLP